MNEQPYPEVQKLTPEDLARQKARSKALGLVLGALVVLFFIVTIAKLGGNVWNREL